MVPAISAPGEKHQRVEEVETDRRDADHHVAHARLWVGHRLDLHGLRSAELAKQGNAHQRGSFALGGDATPRTRTPNQRLSLSQAEQTRHGFRPFPERFAHATDGP
jgi:hypothetical protein